MFVISNIKSFFAHCSVFCRFCPFTPTHTSVSGETPCQSEAKCVCARLCLCLYSVCVCIHSPLPELSEAYCVVMHTCTSHEGSTHWKGDGPRATIIHMEGPSQFSCCHTMLSGCMAKQPALRPGKLSAGSGLHWSMCLFGQRLVLRGLVFDTWKTTVCEHGAVPP